MSKLQSALEKLEIYTDYYDDHSTKGIIQAAEAELNDHLRLYSAVHEHLRECNLYPMNIKEMLKMFEEVSGCSGVPLFYHGMTQFDTEEEYNVRR